MLKIRRLQLLDIEVFLMAAICATFLSPYIQRTLGTAAVLMLVGVYLILRINDFLHCEIHERNVIILIFLYFGLVLLYTFLGFSDKGAGQTNSLFFFFSFFLIVPIHKSLKREHCIFIIMVCVLTICMTMAQNYRLWVRMGFRYTQQWYKRAGLKEVINTQYVSALMLFSGVSFSLFLYKRETKFRFVFLILAVICFVFNVTITQRTIALLLSIVMFSLLVLLNGKVTPKKIILYTLFMIFAILLVLDYQVILNTIAEVIGSDRMKRRINTLISLFSLRNIADVEEGSLTIRIHLIGVSISTFWGSLSNFLIGVGDKADDLLVGNHSQFFDEFAKFGVFGGLLSCTVVLGMIKTAFTVSTVSKSEPLYKLLSLLYFIMICRALVGGIFAPAIGVVMFVVAPLSFKIMKQDEGMIREGKDG